MVSPGAFIRNLTLAALFAAALQQGLSLRSEAAPLPERDFFEILDGLLSDFEIDLSQGKVRGTDDLALQPPTLSPTLPPSFSPQLANLLAERLLRSSGGKTKRCSTSCPPSKTRLDARIQYLRSGILLSLAVIDASTQSTLWARTYSSEEPRLTRSVHEITSVQDYLPSSQHRLSTYVLMQPTASGQIPCLGLSWRSMSRFFQRKSEWGFELSFLRDANSLLGVNPETPHLFSSLHLGALVLGGVNLISYRDNPNSIRLGLIFGVGGAFSSGYLSAHARTGFELRLGHHSGFSLIAGFRPNGAGLIGANSSINPAGGLEYGLGFHYLF